MINQLILIICFSFGLGALISYGSSLLIPVEATVEKTSAYECGFEPFEDARSQFDVRFYLVALLFIIFDLEVAFLFLVVNQWLSASATGGLIFFLLVLTLGFIYEWSQGALNWS